MRHQLRIHKKKSRYTYFEKEMQKVSSQKKKIMHTKIVWIIIKIEVTLGKSLSLQQMFLSVKRDMMKPNGIDSLSLYTINIVNQLLFVTILFRNLLEKNWFVD